MDPNHPMSRFKLEGSVPIEDFTANYKISNDNDDHDFNKTTWDYIPASTAIVKSCDSVINADGLATTQRVGQR